MEKIQYPKSKFIVEKDIAMNAHPYNDAIYIVS